MQGQTQDNQRFLESRRNIHKGQRCLDVPVPSSGLGWEHGRVLAQPNQRRTGSQAFLPESSTRQTHRSSTGNQCRSQPVLSKSSQQAQEEENLTGQL